MSIPPKSIRKKRRRFTKLVRRAHLYTGMLLLPWVILFGLSGMLFNHGQHFGPLQSVAEWTSDQIADSYGFASPDAKSLATELVENLNHSAGEQRFVLADDRSPTLEGTYSYETLSDQGKLQVRISSNRGDAQLLQFPAEKSHSTPPFAQASAEIASFDAKATEQLAASLLADANLQTQDSIEASARGFTELRLQVETPEDNRRWNVVYKLLDGSLSGRAVDEVPDNDFYSVVTRLHKTHHYPDRRGARWVWTAFADASGIGLVFWGVSGLIMWWQMKPTRVIGIASLSLAGVLGVVIFSATIADQQFAPARSSGKPNAGKAPADPSKKQSPVDSQEPQTPSTHTSLEQRLSQPGTSGKIA